VSNQAKRHLCMIENPNNFADHLIELHGFDGARQTARDGITTAQVEEDNYTLSIWREIRRAIEIKRDVADNQSGSKA
jgi:hypothetical protein